MRGGNPFRFVGPRKVFRSVARVLDSVRLPRYIPSLASKSPMIFFVGIVRLDYTTFGVEKTIIRILSEPECRKLRIGDKGRISSSCNVFGRCGAKSPVLRRKFGSDISFGVTYIV